MATQTTLSPIRTADKKEQKSYAQFSGIEKAASLLLAVRQDLSSKIVEQLEEDEVKELSQVMATLGNVKADILEEIYREFARQIYSAGGLVGTYDATENLLLNFLSRDQVDGIMSDIRGPAGRTMWEKLANVSEDFLANYLKNEYPQTVAVVLSKIKPEQAARVIPLLPESFALDVVMRMLKMESIQRDVLEEVERTLRSEFMSNFARIQKRDSHELMAEIFNYFNRTNEARYLQALEEKDVEAASRVKSLMFVFDDMTKISGDGIQLIIRTVDRSKLALSLKGASDKVRDLFLRNMSERSAKLMKEEIQNMGLVRIRDVDEAQSQVIASTKELVQRGQIKLHYGEDEGFI